MTYPPTPVMAALDAAIHAFIFKSRGRHESQPGLLGITRHAGVLKWPEDKPNNQSGFRNKYSTAMAIFELGWTMTNRRFSATPVQSTCPPFGQSEKHSAFSNCTASP